MSSTTTQLSCDLYASSKTWNRGRMERERRMVKGKTDRENAGRHKWIKKQNEESAVKEEEQLNRSDRSMSRCLHANALLFCCQTIRAEHTAACTFLIAWHFEISELPIILSGEQILMKGNCESSAIFAAKAVFPLCGGPDGVCWEQREGTIYCPTVCVCICVCVKNMIFFTWIISNACLWVCPKINRQLTVWLTIQEATSGSTCCFFFFTCVHARDVAVNWNTLFVSAIARWNNSMYLNILNLNVTVICTDLTALQHELNWKLYQYWLNNEDHQN